MEEHFSKRVVSLNSLEENYKMEFGTMIHEILELIDFKIQIMMLFLNLEKE